MNNQASGDQEEGRSSLRAALKKEFVNMSAIQLKKQRIKSIHELQEIHASLQQLIGMKKEEAQKLSDNFFVQKDDAIEKQIKRSLIIQNGLNKSLENFEFMLTHDYSQKMQQQIGSTKARIKRAKDEVGLLKRQMQIPMQKEIKLRDQLQIQVQRLARQIQQIRLKNVMRSTKISEIKTEIQLKGKQLNKISEQFIDFEDRKSAIKRYQESERQGILYTELQEKKKKLNKIIENINRSNKLQHRKYIKQIEVLNAMSTEISVNLEQIDELIQMRSQEMRAKRAELNKIKNKQGTSARKFFRVKTQNYDNSKNPLSELPYYKRKKQSGLKGALKKEDSRYRTETSQQKNNDRFPSIYEYVGKNRLLLEQQCNLSDLVYQGANGN